MKEQLAKANRSVLQGERGKDYRVIYIIDGIFNFIQRRKKEMDKKIMIPRAVAEEL
ncbi:hypothetical protein AAHB61_30300 [Bacillus cereus]